MCRLCELAEGSASYISKMDAMAEEDVKRLERTRTFTEKFPSLKASLYTTLEWPLKLSKPLFEARNAFTLPNNYFQQLHLSGARLPNKFAHGSTRSIFFSGPRLILLSKSIGQDAGVDFFSSFLLFHFGKEEYSAEWDGKNLTLSIKAKKKARNLITGEAEEAELSANFQHMSVEGRILQKEEALRSDFIRKLYKKRMPTANIFASADLEGYVVSVKHFSPHPYMLQAKEDFGYPTNRSFQEHLIEYIISHLGLA